MASRVWFRALLTVGGIMGAALVMRYTIVPSEEQMLSRISPELRAEYERNKGKRRDAHEEIMKRIMEDSKSDKPIWLAAAASERSKDGDDPRAK
ncbi:assembly factor cbp4 [Coemansia sp. RSA 2049]|nr:assembly factor cbp4 [Coemansia sp. RSA 1939]KAJ2520365.1 assembly factor cbp4 [Coemansia sp. RSA 2049]KAJ2616750.1 assembly factor cbp4 [Coemansia sp. RSA 1804]KAJ2672147.1 assembly factor cbp4 [Coemansia sp. RSA 1285]